MLIRKIIIRTNNHNYRYQLAYPAIRYNSLRSFSLLSGVEYLRRTPRRRGGLRPDQRRDALDRPVFADIWIRTTRKTEEETKHAPNMYRLRPIRGYTTSKCG